MRKRGTIILSVILCVVLSLGCCGFASASENRVQIGFISNTREFQSLIEQYYMENHPELDPVFWLHEVNDKMYQRNLDKKLKKEASDDIPDLFTLDETLVRKYVDGKNTGDLMELGFTEKDFADIYPAVLEIGSDKNGTLKAISWQMCPTVLVYRASLAEKYLGAASPEEFQELVKDYETFLDTAKKLDEASEKNCKILAGTGDLEALDKQWKLADDRNQQMTLKKFCQSLKSGKLTWNAKSGSDAWLSGMRGEKETLAYILPVRDIEKVLMPNCVAGWDASNPTGEENIRNASENGTYGDWRVVTGPYNTITGGSWIAINIKKLEQADDEKKAAIKELISFIVLDKAFLKQYVSDSGVSVSNSAAVKDMIEDGNGIPFLGGQDPLPFIDEAAKNVHIKK